MPALSPSGRRSVIRADASSSADGRSGRLRLLLDEDEGRILAAHPDLDVPLGELRRDLDGGLAERLQQAHPGRAADRLAQAGGGLGDRVVADGGDPVEVGLERLEKLCHLHDVIMTSLVASVKCHLDVFIEPVLRAA